jgi:hypothetical protein
LTAKPLIGWSKSATSNIEDDLVFAAKKAPFLFLALATFFSWSAHGQENNMKISITIKDKVITATMADNETARDFISLLPLTITLEDYSKTEKISDLPKKLTKAGAPAGIDPAVGDITYYAPLGKPGDILPGFWLFNRAYQARNNRFRCGGIECLRLRNSNNRCR